MRTRKRTRSEASVQEESCFVPDLEAVESDGLAKALPVPENVDAKDIVGAPLCNDILIRARLSRMPLPQEEEEAEGEAGKTSTGLAATIVEHAARCSGASSRFGGLRVSYFFQRSSSLLDEIVLLLGCSDRKFNPFWMANRAEEALRGALDHRRPLLNVAVKPVLRRADTVRQLVDCVNASKFSRRRKHLEEVHSRMLLPSKSSAGMATYVEWNPCDNVVEKRVCPARDPDPAREVELPVVIDPIDFACCDEEEDDDMIGEEEDYGDDYEDPRGGGRRMMSRRRRTRGAPPLLLYCCSSAAASEQSEQEQGESSGSDRHHRDEKKKLDVGDPLEKVTDCLQRVNPAAASKVAHARRECSMTGSKKRREWLDFVARLPLSRGCLPALDRKGDVVDERCCARMLESAGRELDSTVYGMHGAKNAAIEMVARTLSYAVSADHEKDLCLSPPLRSLLFEGPPGSGKTTFVTRALGSVLRRPVRLINVGGAKDASSLVGISYSYEGSRPGRIAEEIVSTGVMDPIIVFDEVDKVSDTAVGHEIINVLMSLVDPTQNHSYSDVYLAGVPLDLSRVLFVMTCNDASLVNPVLLDRVRVVSVPALSGTEHVDVTRDYVFPRVAARCCATDKSRVVLENGAAETLVKSCSSLSPTNNGSTGTGIRDIEKLVERVIMRAELRNILRDNHGDRDSEQQVFTVTLQDVSSTMEVIREERRIAETAADRALRREHFASMYT